MTIQLTTMQQHVFQHYYNQWHVYCPQGAAWVLESYLTHPSFALDPMGGFAYWKMHDDLWFFEAFRSAGFVLTRQGWERYEQLLRLAAEETARRERAVRGHQVTSVALDDPLPKPGLRGQSVLDPGYVFAPYVPLQVEPLYFTIRRTRRGRS
jgi:hypothetical protein